MLKFLNILFKDFCRIFFRSIVYVIIAVIASMITSSVWSNAFAANFNAQTAYRMNTIRYGMAGVWAILIVFAAVMVVVVACQWFGEDILTNRSYLNHMLPIYTWELVVSKAIAGLLVLLCAAAILTYDVLRVANSISVVGDLLAVIPDLSKSDGIDFDLPMFIRLGVYFVLMLCLFVMSTAFMSQTFGQLASRGFARNFLIFFGFFALVFISGAILLTVFRAGGVTINFRELGSLQGILDMAKKLLKLISNTNLAVSILYMTGASLILTYRLNV